LATILTVLTMLATVAGAGATEHSAVKPVTITITTMEELNPGVEWTDADGTAHFRGAVSLEEVSGDIQGTATNTFNGDFVITGECNEEFCEGLFLGWVELQIESEGGGWSGQAGYVTPETGFESIHGQLVGHGAYAGQRILIDTFVGDTDDSITLSGLLLNNAGAKAGVSILFDACFTGYDEITGNVMVSGGFLMSGPAEDSGSMNAVVTPVGVPETAVVYGDVTFSGTHGELYGALITASVGSGDAQGLGTFMLLGGTGVYEGVYGFGKAFETVVSTSACEGVQGQWLGESFS
jgi:hypothetical protein